MLRLSIVHICTSSNSAYKTNCITRKAIKKDIFAAWWLKLLRGCLAGKLALHKRGATLWTCRMQPQVNRVRPLPPRYVQISCFRCNYKVAKAPAMWTYRGEKWDITRDSVCRSVMNWPEFKLLTVKISSADMASCLLNTFVTLIWQASQAKVKAKGYERVCCPATDNRRSALIWNHCADVKVPRKHLSHTVMNHQGLFPKLWMATVGRIFVLLVLLAIMFSVQSDLSTRTRKVLQLN